MDEVRGPPLAVRRADMALFPSGTVIVYRCGNYVGAFDQSAPVLSELTGYPMHPDGYVIIPVPWWNRNYPKIKAVHNRGIATVSFSSKE